VADQPFNMDIDLRGDQVVVRLAGELDVASAPRLRQGVLDTLNPPAADGNRNGNGGRTVVLELGEVDFVDSTGLGVMVGLLKRLRADGGELVLRGVQPATTKVLEMTGLDRVFEVQS
jgi:anti-sigma B factor antagonist